MSVSSFFIRDMTISFRKHLAVTLLFSSSFAWFFVFYLHFGDIFTGFTSDFWSSIGSIIFLVSTVVSATVGASVANRINRRKFLFWWIIFGVIAVAPIPFIRGIELSLFFSVMAGALFGVGFPSCMAFLADSTTVEERGRVSGLAILVTFVLTAFLIFTASAMGFPSIPDVQPSQPNGLVMLSIGIKLVGLLAFALDPMDRKKAKVRSWSKILMNRDFALYTLVYVLFNIAAGLVSFILRGIPSTPEFESVTSNGTLIRFAGLGVFAIIAGLMADRVGRKIPIYLGLLTLAAAYMLIGLVTTPETYFINLLLSGFAWGIIMVIYLVVPGDLSNTGSTESFYALGWLVPLALFLGSSYIPEFIPAFNIPVDVLAYILSIVLFSSTIPIFSAKETLPETKKHEREIREYLEDKVHKYGKK
jgi:MFS family permease